jgi:ornithine carbamoyltransferase
MEREPRQRFTERARRVVFYAQEEAARLGHNEVDTEHLLLGLLRVEDSGALRVLARLEISPENIQAHVLRQVTGGQGFLGHDMQLTPRADRVLELARDEAREGEGGDVGTGHLLIGLLWEGSGLAARVLFTLGADLERVRTARREGREAASAPPGASEGTPPQERPPGSSGPRPALGHRRLSVLARLALVTARTEAARLGEPYPGTEHLLLALLRIQEATARKILRKLDYPLEYVCVEIGRQLAPTEGDPARATALVLGARRAVDLAREEAARLFHRQVGTEHLLLGLMAEQTGTAARALATVGVEQWRVLERVKAEGGWEDIAGREGTTRGREASGQRSVPPTEGGKGMWQRFTERARRVIFFGQEEAARLGESYVGTEHLLLGLVRESDSVAGRILDRLGIVLSQVRSEIERQVTRGHGNLGQDMQLTPRAKRVIDLAYEEARQLNNNYIGTEHLLLGLIREGDGLAARVLVKLGADLELTRREVYTLQEGESGMGGLPGAAGTAAFLAELRHRLKRINEPDAPASPAEGAPEREPAPTGPETPLDVLRWLAEQGPDYTPSQVAAIAAEAAVRLAREVCGGLTDLRGIGDLAREQAWALLCLARVLKDTLAGDKNAHQRILPGRTLAMIFEKPSLRTRVTFEVGMYQLGGKGLYLQPSDISMGKREPVADVAHNLERWVDGIMARVFSHATILELAENSRVAVINALCDREHPCQALADFQTIWEARGAIEGQKIAYVGDGNNVAHSLLLLGAKLGANVVAACPKGYEPLPEIVAQARADAEAGGGSVTVTNDPREACADADVIYTDVWASMGQESEAAERAQVFAPFQVNEELVSIAKPDFLFMHCLPAHRGEEVSARVMDGPNSVVFDEAENRLHAQKAVLAVLLR